jgi:carboxypeptidase C (cathepsin A)
MKGTWSERGQTHLLHLDTLLIINGCIDRYVQWPAYPKMMYNNTYGIKAVNESRYEGVIDDLYRENGCLDQIEQCRNISLVYDPTNQGFNETVNKVCADAETFCSENIRDPFFDTDLNYYDISAPGAASFPPPWYVGWLNQPHVQQGLGVPLNWTQSNSAVSRAFRNIGDYPRPGWKEDLAYLLEEGVKVTLMYGDRDYACNWYGGELLSLAIPYENATSFAAAGYADVVVNSTYVGGQTRQYGNLSFTRVYEAGHEVSNPSMLSRPQILTTLGPRVSTRNRLQDLPARPLQPRHRNRQDLHHRQPYLQLSGTKRRIRHHERAGRRARLAVLHSRSRPVHGRAV